MRELGVVLPAPASPLAAYVEVSRVGSLLFLSGTSPLVNRKLANLFVQLFGAEAGHVPLVCDVYCAPIRAPVMVQAVFEIG